MGTLNCQMQIPSVAGLDDAKVTVGRHVVLGCKGEAAEFDVSKAMLKVNESNKDHFHLFKVAGSADQGLQVEMTFYTAGPQPLDQLVLTDGAHELSLSGEPVKIESVLQPPSEKPQEPFGPVFPVPISIPVSYYLALTGVIVLFGIFTFVKAKRLAYYTKLKNKLQQYSSPIAPDTQFYRAIRTAEKAQYPLEQIEKAFRLYNVRAYRLPLFDLPDEKIGRYFRRNYPECKSTRSSLQKLLSEFQELSRIQNLTFETKSDFVKKLYRYVDKNRGIEF